MYMKAKLGISLYSYPQLAKCFVFLLCLCLLFNKIRDKGRTGLLGSEGAMEERMGEGGKGEK
jgi:hypothetical protein